MDPVRPVQGATRMGGQRGRGGCGRCCSRPVAAEAGGGSEPSYPDREISFVVPFAAGGPTDTVTRLVAEPMSAKLGQQIVVQNVEGAGGTVAAGRGRQCRRRRLHGADAPHRHVDGPGAVPEPGVQAAGGLQDGRPGHQRADDDRRPQGLRAQHAQELVTYVKANADKVTYRQCRHRRRLPAVRPADREGHGGRPHRGALRRHRAGAHRPGRRTGRLHVRPDHQHHGPDQGRARSRRTP